VGRVLVVDDERSLRDVLEVLISSKGHAVQTAPNVEEARAKIIAQDFDLIVTDLRLEPDGDGMDVVLAAREVMDRPEVIVMTAFGTREKALEAHAAGALFYLEKGPHLASDMSVLVAHAIEKRALKIENQQLRSVLSGRHRLGGIVGKSACMQEVFGVVERVAPTRANILLMGESGTGKERLARVVHDKSMFSSGPFVPLNCGAIPENLMEAELFGYVKGAFTGADTDKEGLFQSAKAGTIFLDEIGEMPISLQPKLLRVLQERKTKPVGGTHEIDVNVRIIAATNRDLEAEIKAGRFREDLYFRLNVVELSVPPLRQRPEDIPILANSFLQHFAMDYQRDVTAIAPEAMELLLPFTYPGNVRQLENIIERAVALCMGRTLTTEHLPKALSLHKKANPSGRVLRVDASTEIPDSGMDLDAVVEDFESKLIRQALVKTAGVKTKAAELLGLSFRQFRYKLSKHALSDSSRTRERE
jgi:two-component system, NtrC family, response regulator PilR